ncbi:MAG TPA: hypothetical protein VMG12_06400, partial [Polyangiaceae bacterium]|nr:hypothetical protein [Polyangiaceae bacterium]
MAAPPASAEPAAPFEEAAPVYGTGVPYGGDEHTEEIDPVALDTPFTPDDRNKTPAAPAAASSTPKAPPAGPARHLDMKAPAAQLLLSDLFDSVPSSGALAPPDPSAFSSSRPPPAERRASEPPRDAIVGLPNINIGSGDAANSAKTAAKSQADAEVAHLINARPPEPEVAHRSSPRAPMPTPPPAPAPDIAPRAPAVAARFEPVPHTRDPEMAKPTVRLSADPEMSTATQRLSVPGFVPERGAPLDSNAAVDPEMFTATQRLVVDPALIDPTRGPDPEMSTATIKLSRDMLPALGGIGSGAAPGAAAGSSPSHSRPSNPPPRAPMPSSPALASEPRHEPAANEASPAQLTPPSGDVARFPSEVATSRPPDVLLTPGASPTSASQRPSEPRPSEARPSREPKPPMTAVTAPASSQFGK